MNRVNLKALGFAVAITFGVLTLGYKVVALSSNTNSVTSVKTVETQFVPDSKPSAAMNSVKNKKIWNLKLDRNQFVGLFGEIGANGAYVAEEITQKASAGKPLYLLISSPGGSVLDGALIINAIEASPVPVYTVCLDLCASMAAIIHQYGTERMMVDRSILMFHDAAGGFRGYFPHINSRFSTIDRYIARFNVYISARTGMPLDDLVRAEHTELWIDAEDSTLRKFNDKLVHIQLEKSTAKDELSLSTMLRPKGKEKKILTDETGTEVETPKFFDVYWISK